MRCTISIAALVVLLASSGLALPGLDARGQTGPDNSSGPDNKDGPDNSRVVTRTFTSYTTETLSTSATEVLTTSTVVPETITETITTSTVIPETLTTVAPSTFTTTVTSVGKQVYWTIN